MNRAAGRQRVKRVSGQVGLNLVANVIQGVLGVALLPLATRILGPQEYGTYGMAVVIVGLAGALCETAAAYILYAHYDGLSEVDRRALLASLVFLEFSVGACAALILWMVWTTLGAYDPILASLHPTEIALACLSVPWRTVLRILFPALIAQKRSN